jgi:hypothetical protein
MGRSVQETALTASEGDAKGTRKMLRLRMTHKRHDKLADRTGFEPTTNFGKRQVIDFTKRENRQKRAKRPFEVHGAYAEVGSCSKSSGGPAEHLGIIVVAVELLNSCAR